MLEEAKWMRRLDFKIPQVMQNVAIANVKKTYSRLAVSNYLGVGAAEVNLYHFVLVLTGREEPGVARGA